MNEDPFEQQLHPELQASYRKEYRDLIRQKKRFYRQEAENLKNTFLREIEINQSHDDIVNLCIHPFEEESMPTRKLGYVFEVADPLYEKGENKPPIFDFLIVNRKMSTAIFGEAKSQIHVSNIEHEISDFEKKIDYVESKLDFIKEHYLKLRNDPIREYVLAVKPELVSEVGYHIHVKDRKIILWQADVANFRLSLARPRDDTKKFVGRTHGDADLNRFLGDDGIRSTVSVYSVFPLSHMFSKLLLLIQSRNQVEDSHLVVTEILRKRIDSYFPKLNYEEKAEIVQSIINEGLKIKFIVPDPKLNGSYRIKSRSREEDSLGPELRKMWVQSRLEEKRDDDIRQSIVALQNDFLTRPLETRTLQYFSNQPELPFTERRGRRKRKA